MTYSGDGMGRGQVGEFAIEVAVTQIAPGQYTAQSRVPHGWGLGWIATDGNFTLLGDGTMHVKFPSNGIVEYWMREGASPLMPVAYAVPASESAPSYNPSYNPSYSPSRPVKLAIRRFAKNSDLGSLNDLCYHWGVCIGDENSCYEVQGSMVVFGPNGLVAASSPLMIRLSPTNISQYQGVCEFGKYTNKSNADVEAFSKQWVKNHPMYHIPGPNCQTYAEDLFTFLTGENLPFAMSTERLRDRSLSGPEKHPGMRWF